MKAASTYRKLVLVLLLTVFASYLALSARQIQAEEADQNAAKAAAQQTAQTSLLKKINDNFFALLFFDVAVGSIQVDKVSRTGTLILDSQGHPQKKTVPFPFLVAFLLSGAVFFTFWYRWINLRGLKHAFNVLRGKYNNSEDKGEISYFRALTSALSATVGLGNIAGVAVAIQTGGPGAVFWMMFTAIFSMTAKFSSCTLAQMFRKTNRDGSISGGPMYYLDIGLREKGKYWAPLGKLLAFFYAFMIMAGAIGPGNMFQANQTTESIVNTFQLSQDVSLYVGIILAFLVAAVILGGIKRIGLATSRIVPTMCTIYVIACLFVILTNIEKIPECLMLIVRMAFTENAFFGGMVGVLVTGITRASFSNEGGLGSASIAYAAAKGSEPVRAGIVSMIGPVVDTMIVCLMTALVVVITGVWNNPELALQSADYDTTMKGVTLTSEAFATVIPWFPYVLTLCIALFAYSTVISWCYYGERGWIYVFDHFGGHGLSSVFIFRIAFVCFIVVGSVNRLSDVLDFSDAVVLSMAFPNILGSIILAPRILEELRKYWKRYASEEVTS